jgi:tetrahydromethanopterin S-methyltransferase subunit G
VWFEKIGALIGTLWESLIGVLVTVIYSQLYIIHLIPLPLIFPNNTS